MLLDYAGCASQYANAYQINQAIQENRLYRIERGIYVTTPCSRLTRPYCQWIFSCCGLPSVNPSDHVTADYTSQYR